MGEGFDKYIAQGFRLVWINGYTVQGVDRYAVIWEKSGEPEWLSFSNGKILVVKTEKPINPSF